MFGHAFARDPNLRPTPASDVTFQHAQSPPTSQNHAPSYLPTQPKTRLISTIPEILLLCIMHVTSMLVDMAAGMADHAGHEKMARGLLHVRDWLNKQDDEVFKERVAAAEGKDDGQAALPALDCAAG